MLLFVLENFEDGLIPSLHYDTLLHAMLLYETTYQIHTLQSILRDLAPFYKVILEKVLTTLSQICFSCTSVSTVPPRPARSTARCAPRHRARARSRVHSTPRGEGQNRGGARGVRRSGANSIRTSVGRPGADSKRTRIHGRFIQSGVSCRCESRIKRTESGKSWNSSTSPSISKPPRAFHRGYCASSGRTQSGSISNRGDSRFHLLPPFLRIGSSSASSAKRP